MKHNNQSNRVTTATWSLAVLIATLILLWSYPVMAGGSSSARSVAMGGAHIGLAKGVDAAKYNPANLGLTDYRLNNLELAGIGASIANNSFTLDDYNTYTGAFLTDDDKTDILHKIPNDGLRFTVDVEASAMAFSMGNFAFATIGVGLADINLNKDLADLVLNGNTYADTIEVTGSYSDALGYVSGGLSYGMPLMKLGSKELTIGATGKYIKGLGVERVVKLQGMATTHEYGYSGEGQMIVQTATGGNGYAIDIGAALKINNDFTAGVCIKNILSSISWNNRTEEHGYIFSFDTMTVENADDDDLVVSEDYSEDISSFSTTLPSVMTIGFAKTSGNFIWAIDYEQGFRKKAAGASTKPRLSIGLEWSPLNMLPLRTGFAAGGDRNTSFSIGSGFNCANFYMDFAALVGTSFSGYSSKEVNLAFTTGLCF